MKMNMQKSLMSMALAMGVSVTSLAANAAMWDVTVTNLTNGNHFTPLLVTAHSSTESLFTTGAAAGVSLQSMAECGDLSGLITDIGGEDADTIANPVGATNGNLLAPGSSTTAMLTTTNTHLSIVGMILPSNDGFIGLGSVEVPTAAGTYTYYVNGYDAGTEANTELKDTAESCAINQAGYPGAPSGSEGMNGTGMVGVDSNTMVHIHRGVLGDSDATGGLSDLDSTVHRWQNPMAKVTVTVK
ncbi:MAG: spondin domain-containing protein [Gammaproteobacteria bacterium]|nr:spondin domain-containing protein [Gammaproteobacteria bacterium]